MKKIIALAIIAVMMVALCIGVSARASIDRLTINNNTLPTMPDDETNLRNNDEIRIAKGDKLFMLGWAINVDTSSTLKEVVYTIDGTEYACADNYRDRGDVAAYLGVDGSLGTHAGIGHDENAFELVGIDGLNDGSYAFSIVAKYQDGTSEVINKEYTLIVGNGGGAAAQNYVAVPNANLTDGIWLQLDGEYVAAEFTTTGAFNRVYLPITWSSRKDANRECNVILDLYKFEYNVENTLSKAPVKSYTYEIIGDNDPLCALDLGENVAAGTYIFKITVSGDKLTGDFNSEANAYFVLDHATADADLTKVKFINTEKTFAFSVTGDAVDGDFFATNPEDTDVPAQPVTQPETQPQTGDAAVAMIAVIAVLAMGAAVVFARKRSY